MSHWVSNSIVMEGLWNFGSPPSDVIISVGCGVAIYTFFLLFLPSVHRSSSFLSESESESDAFIWFAL